MSENVNALDTPEEKPKKQLKGIAKQLHDINPSPEYISNSIDFALAITPPDNYDRTDVNQVKERFEFYLDMCKQYGKKPGNMACYRALGYTKNEVATKICRQPTNPVTVLLKNICAFMAQFREDLIASQEIPVPIGIFWQKNYDGFSDVTTIQVDTSKVDELPPDQLIETVKDLHILARA